MTDDTMLHRQINPGWVQNGRVTSQAFRPTPKDENKLSVYDGDMISAEQSWKHFAERGYKSLGVLSITVRECTDDTLPVEASPEVFEQHVHIDFTGLTEGQKKTKGKRLLGIAIGRGWQYQA